MCHQGCIWLMGCRECHLSRPCAQFGLYVLDAVTMQNEVHAVWPGILGPAETSPGELTEYVPHGMPFLPFSFWAEAYTPFQESLTHVIITLANANETFPVCQPLLLSLHTFPCPRTAPLPVPTDKPAEGAQMLSDHTWWPLPGLGV